MSQCYCEDCQEIKHCHSSVIEDLQNENARLREALEYVIEMADYINTRDTIQKKARAALEKK